MCVRPSDVTMNGTFLVIKPAMKLTSRANRSSLATTTAHFSFQRRLQLWAPVERVRTLAALDLDEVLGDVEPFGFGELNEASRYASMPRPDLPCWDVETRR
jgi:hypothetical protein